MRVVASLYNISFRYINCYAIINQIICSLVSCLRQVTSCFRQVTSCFRQVTSCFRQLQWFYQIFLRVLLELNPLQLYKYWLNNVNFVLLYHFVELKIYYCIKRHGKDSKQSRNSYGVQKEELRDCFESSHAVSREDVSS